MAPRRRCASLQMPRPLLAAVLLSAACRADDIATVRARMLEAYAYPPSYATPSGLAAAAAAARADAARLLPNGTWPDINYSDFNSRTIWATAAHTARVQAMAAVLSYSGSPVYNDAAVFNATRRALSAWLTHDWRNANWWWDILQTPQTIALSVLALDTLPGAPSRAPFPSPAELSASLAIVFRAAWWNASLGYEVTGTNLAWMVQAQLLRGAWPSLVNESALAGGFARLWQEVHIAPWDPTCGNGTNQGVQVDYSWHFHGAQLQTADYGQAFLDTILSFVTAAANTTYAFDESRAAILCDYAVGTAWVAAGSSFDWTSAGRSLDRSSWSGETRIQINASALRAFSARCAPAARATIATFADAFDAATAGRAPAAVAPGHRHFWTSDYAVFKRPGWSASWKGLSNRTEPLECGNGENLLAMYAAQGVVNVVAEGAERCVVDANPPAGRGPLGWGCGLEYALLFPLLDWTAINGATALTGLPTPPCGPSPQCCWVAGVVKTRRSFVGGASDGAYGIAAMDTSYLSLSARTATLFFDAAIVSLGADIAESSGRSGVQTALASRFLRADAAARTGLALGFANGTVAAAGANSSATAVRAALPAGGAGSAALAWAFADGVGWLTALDGAYPPAAVDAGPRAANWSVIGCYPGTVEGDALTLTISQGGGGGAPLAGAAFAYATLPSTTAAATAAAAAPGGVRAALALDALVNTRALQAMTQVDAAGAVAVMEAVFWEPGAYTAGNVTVAVDAPCLLTYRAMQGGAVLAVASPDAWGLVVHVSVRPPPCPAIAFALNDPARVDYLGQSRVVTLACAGGAGGCCEGCA